MTTWWCELAALPTGITDSVRIETRAGRITGITSAAPAGPGDITLRGLVLPGLANAHSHAFHRALRGRTHARGGTFWTWREDMYAVARELTPDGYLALARGVFTEMVAAGYTVVGEFHYLHHDGDGLPYADPNAMGAAVAQAAAEAGIRLTLLDTLYLSGGLTVEGYQPLDEVQRRYSDGSVEQWVQRLEALSLTGAARLGAAIHSVRAVPAEHLGEVSGALAALRSQRGESVPLHVHLSEQQAENVACLAVHGCTPTELLHDSGLLGPAMTAVHATHVSGQDIALLGGSATGSCCCPTTEADLADGIGPARALAAAGSPLSIGSDQHAVIDPFTEIRGVELQERLRSLERGRFTPGELLTIATANGYAALGWPDGGRFEVGALADLVAVSSTSRRTAGAEPAQLIFAASAADVTDVVVAGEQVVRDGVHRLGPVDDVVDEALR